MKNLFLIPNMDKSASLTIAEGLLRESENRGGSSVIFRPSAGKAYPEAADVPEDAELIVALGGDGTVIRAASSLISLDLPVMGVNTGSVGFLTGIDGKEYGPGEILDRLMNEDYREEKRMLLAFEVYRNGGSIAWGVAMNDVTLRSSFPGRSIEWSFSVDGTEAQRYIGEGMIISSPTGSTAYNLSAGGPIALPTDELLLATPLRPHSFQQRSFVLPAGALVTLKLSGSRRNDGILFCDGDSVPNLSQGDEVRVWSPERKVRLLTMRKTDFFEALRENFSL